MAKRPPGRPKVDATDRSELITITLPGRAFDAFAKRALARGESLPAVIRGELLRVKPPAGTKDSSD